MDIPVLEDSRCRLIFDGLLREREIYLKALLTHKENDRKEWTKWR